MFVQKVAIVAMSALTVVSAGNSTFTIDPNSVTLSLRASWCTSERNACTQICGNAPDNDCDVNTLSYSCTCDDGTSPDMNEYANSLPFYICQQAFTNCIAANVGSATGQANCTTSIQDNCGTKNASSAATTTSSAASTSSTGTATGTAATNSGSATSTSSSAGGSMPTGIQHLSNGAIAVAGLLAFAL
ncbi:hypothetical protein BKA67DRAFT_95590 [Truncatella angustata]|uniref:DUF7707 domain-containing protein n=1 Tax=Truncatella angustata TaxID=152316 RepID=A0A9P8RHX9_9PEZI|nr:uncharacterized protein BKA67DRAFT_95590 [Truncatella angustata]KAH6646154.1 hypothetical protein BKA67DRAFT_95590 [Truncatella angustata]